MWVIVVGVEGEEGGGLVWVGSGVWVSWKRVKTP